MDERCAKLKRLCEDAINDPALKAVDVYIDNQKVTRTYCNKAVQKIARGMDVHVFLEKGMTADQIYDYCASNWVKVDGEWAAEFAKAGGLGIAAVKGDPHGHCAVVAPIDAAKSPSWGCVVPVVANVGNNNGFMLVSAAFKKSNRPDYFVCKQEVK